MSIVHPLDPDGPVAFACAQSGCQVCLEALIHRHEGLVHTVLRRQARGGVEYAELLQAGRIGLWQAVLHFDPHRGVAFSTYAGIAIERWIWRVVARANRPRGRPPPPEPPNPLQIAEENPWQAKVHSALTEAVTRLPKRLRQVVVAAYGLDGESPRTLDALLLLRLPLFSSRLRCLCDQASREAYARTQALNRAWLRQKRGRRR
jgi:RNA polymerase sigma factor (sigma-70 family)